jgi:hypothetical protein
MNHRATILAILLPAALFVAVERYPGAVRGVVHVLRATLALVT